MSEMPSEQSDGIISTATKITAVFVVLAVAATYVSTTVSDSNLVHAAVLLTVGVVVPTLVNEWRHRA